MSTTSPTSSPRHAVVTGAAGFIGSHLVDRLLADGWLVTGVDNFDPFYPREAKARNIAAHLVHPQYRMLELDIRDLDGLRQRLDGRYDVFVHLAARAGVRPSILDPLGYQDVNVKGTQNLLELAKERSVPQFVFASSSSVYGVNPNVPWREADHVLLPISPYASTKVSGELLGHVYSHLYGLRFVALRFFTVYGPRQRPDMGFHRFFTALRQGQPLVQFGDGLQTRDFTYVGDAATATADAAVRGVAGRVYNIGGGARVSLREVFDLIARVSGRKVTLDLQGPQKGDMRDTYADTSRAKADLGFAPSVTLEEGLRRMWQWMESSQ